MGNLPAKFKFTRTVFGIIMVGAAFVTWGRWVTAILGALFIISAATGWCITCEIYTTLTNSKKCDVK